MAGMCNPSLVTIWKLVLKRDWANGEWNSTLSVYRILKNNELVADPNAAPSEGLSIELGQKRVTRCRV